MSGQYDEGTDQGSLIGGSGSTLALQLTAVLVLVLTVLWIQFSDRLSFMMQVPSPKHPSTSLLWGHLPMYRAVGPFELNWACRRVADRGVSWFRFGPTLFIYLSTPELISKVLMSKDISKGVAKDEMAYVVGKQSVLLQAGADWSKTRKLVNRSFFVDSLRNMFPAVLRMAQELPQEVLEEHSFPSVFDASRSGQETGAVVFDAQQVSMGTALEIICRTAFAQPNRKLKDQEKISGAVAAIFSEMQRLIAHPFDLWNQSKLSPTRQRFDENISYLRGLIGGIVDEKMRKWRTDAGNSLQMTNPDEQTPEEMRHIVEQNLRNHQVKDLLDTLIAAYDVVDDAQGSRTMFLSREEIMSQAMTFFFAGHETTGSTMSRAFYELARHPQWQDRIYAETQKILMDKPQSASGHWQLEYDDLSKMTDLGNFIAEVLRKYPAATQISRTVDKTTGPMDLGSQLPKAPVGSVLVLDIMSMHHDEKYWDRPDEFDPDRFTGRKNSVPFTYIPFSAGPRNCVGFAFATMEMKTILSEMVRHLIFSLPDPQTDKTSEGTSYPTPDLTLAFTLKSGPGVFVKCTRRAKE